MAQLTLNNTKIIVIDILVFYINYEKYLNLFNILRKLLQIIIVLKDIKQLKHIYKEISKNIKYNQKQSENQINRKRKRKSQFKKENKVYLLTKYLRIIKVNKKLDHKKVSLFYIKEKRSDVNFELELLNWIKIYLVFHVEKLESADSETSV